MEEYIPDLHGAIPTGFDVLSTCPYTGERLVSDRWRTLLPPVSLIYP